MDKMLEPWQQKCVDWYRVHVYRAKSHMPEHPDLACVEASKATCLADLLREYGVSVNPETGQITRPNGTA